MVSSILSFILFREKPAGLLTDVKTCKKLLRIILEKTLEKAGCVWFTMVSSGRKWREVVQNGGGLPILKKVIVC